MRPGRESTSRPYPGASPVPVRYSLRLRLPLLMSVLLVVVVTTCLWAAYREVEATLVGTAGDRAKGAAAQVANLIGRSTQSGMDNLRRIAMDADVRRYLHTPTEDTRDVTRARLASLATSGAKRIELWDVAGSRVLEVSIPAAPVSDADSVELPKATGPPGLGLNPLQAVQNVVFTDSAAEVLPATAAADQTPPARLGYVVVRSTLSVNPPGALGRLVGEDAVIRDRKHGRWHMDRLVARRAGASCRSHPRWRRGI